MNNIQIQYNKLVSKIKYRLQKTKLYGSTEWYTLEDLMCDLYMISNDIEQFSKVVYQPDKKDK